MVARDWLFRSQSDRLASGQGHQTDRTPAVFTGFGAGGLLPVSQGQERAGRPDPDPEYLQKGVGGGHQEYHGGGLRRGVPAMVSAPRKVRF